MAMRVCILSLSDPWHHRHGGALRMQLLVETLASCGLDVHVVYPPATNFAPELASVELHRVGDVPMGEQLRLARFSYVKRRYLPMPSTLGARSTRTADVVRALRPDVFLVSELRVAPYHDVSPGAKLWLDQSDLWSTMASHEIAARSGPSRASASLQRRVIVRQEDRWFARAAAVTAAGWGDTRRIAERGRESVRWLPIVVAGGSARRVTRNRPTAGFLGNFRYWPNVVAYRTVRDWAAKLATMGWETIVAGLGSETLPPCRSIRNVGEVANLSDYYSEIDLSLAPVELGGGIKVKIVEALMWGIPVVATARALDGLPPDLGALIPTVERAGDGLEHAIERAETLGRAATESAERLFSPEAFRTTTNAVIADLG
jgi:glycosyltransferase involved in cell wall biosynthesis